MLSTSHRKALKAWVFAARRAYVRAFRSFGPAQLLATLRDMGVHEGDALMLHSGFSAFSGFTGSVEDLTDVFLEAVGATGHLLMVSLPYRDSSYAYLHRVRQFDVRRTPSMMGMVSELFRRRPGVLRSLHPTHPVLVTGPRAAWFIQDHERCVHPCGPDTPFARLAEVGGKVAFFDVTFETFTFFHHLEHLVHDRLPFDLYTTQLFEVPVVDVDGHSTVVRTHVFAPEAIRRRRFAVLEDQLRRDAKIAVRRIGGASVELVRVRDAIDCTLAMAAQGRYFYDVSPANHPIGAASASGPG